MMTLKFKIERQKELLEYIQIRMKKIYIKYGEYSVNEKEAWYWGTLTFADLNFDDLSHAVWTEYESFPSSEFLFFLYSLDEITADAFDFTKWCIDGFEEWLTQMCTRVKDEERILEELNNSEGHLECKSFKVEQKLEKEKI